MRLLNQGSFMGLSFKRPIIDPKYLAQAGCAGGRGKPPRVPLLSEESCNQNSIQNTQLQYKIHIQRSTATDLHGVRRTSWCCTQGRPGSRLQGGEPGRGTPGLGGSPVASNLLLRAEKAISIFSRLFFLKRGLARFYLQSKI